MEYISTYRDIETQGSNSMKCVGFACSTAIEIGLMMKLGTDNVPDISPQFIYYNAKANDNKYITKGTPTSVGVEQLLKYGACEDSLCPFNPKDGDLISTMNKPSDLAYKNAEQYKPIKVHRIARNVQAIKEAILKYGSVVTSMVYAQGMFSTDEGWIKKPSTIAKIYGGHATCFVGFSDINKCFIQVNSYGESQGVFGKEYLPYDCVESNWWVGRDEANRVFQYCYAIEFGNLKSPNFHIERQPKEVIPTEPKIDMIFTLSSRTAIINGVENIMHEPPLVINGSTMLPMRFIFETLGYSVMYTAESNGHHSIVGKNKYNGRVISMNIGYTVMYSNSQQYISSIAPTLYGGTTYVPLRAVAELSKCKVTYNNSTKEIHITRE